MEFVDLAVFFWGVCRITSGLFSSIISAGATAIKLIINFQVFLEKRGELSGCFIEASSKKVPDQEPNLIGVLKPATADGAIEEFTMGTSDGTVRIINSSCLVFVSACVPDLSDDFVSMIISKSTGMSPIKRFLSILTEYVYWDVFHHSFFIDRRYLRNHAKLKS